MSSRSDTGATSAAAVRTTFADGVLTATLLGPPANALTRELIAGLDAACEFAEREGARVLVVESGVPGFFAAGADLKLLGAADTATFTDYVGTLRAMIDRVAGLAAVSIAAIDGHALGGGLELALGCSVRVAGPAARLGLPEIRLGLLPGAGGTQRLARIVPAGRALDLLLSGRSISGAEAYAAGIVDRLAETTAADAARGLATELRARPAAASAAIRRCVAAARDLPFSDGMRVELDEVTDLFAGAEAREGIAAFLEKRAPRFT